MTKNIKINDLIWVFEADQNLWAVDKEKKLHKVEMDPENWDTFYQTLEQEAPEIYIGGLAGRRIGLKKLSNTRDYGGMQNEEGRFILPKKLIRSTSLHKALKEDLYRLQNEYDLRTVVDFRTEIEKLTQPDASMEGVKKYHFSALKTGDLESLDRGMKKKDLESLLENADELMDRMYIDLIDSKEAVEAYSKFFQALLEQEEGALLWHCTQGKDRTGIGAMLILSALKVPKAKIYEDYLLTNEYLEGYRSDLEESIPQKQDWMDGVQAWSEARKEYLDRAYETIESKYGNVETYLQKGLGLSQEDLEQLRNRYLV